MINLDTSVVLAWLFAKNRAPPDRFWSQVFVASRLLEFEVFNRIHARQATSSRRGAARRLIARVNLLEMSPAVLGRALLPFAQPVRTLAALHLAPMEFMRGQGLSVALANCDQWLAAAAAGMGFDLADC